MTKTNEDSKRVKGDIGRESECWQQVFHFSFRCEDLGFAFLPRIYTKREKERSTSLRDIL
jgi:hypothetical protein